MQRRMVQTGRTFLYWVQLKCRANVYLHEQYAKVVDPIRLQTGTMKATKTLRGL